jgi:hypothetical protein
MLPAMNRTFRLLVFAVFAAVAVTLVMMVALLPGGPFAGRP